MGDKRIALVYQCMGSIGREPAKLLHDRINNVLILERFDIDLLTAIHLRDGIDQRKDHLDLLDDPHRFPEPQKGEPDVAVHKGDRDVAALRFCDGYLHLGARLYSDVDPDLPLEVGEEPLDKERVKVLYFKDISDRRVTGLFFEGREPGRVKLNGHDIRPEFLYCSLDLIDTFLGDVCSPDDP